MFGLSFTRRFLPWRGCWFPDEAFSSRGCRKQPLSLVAFRRVRPAVRSSSFFLFRRAGVGRTGGGARRPARRSSEMAGGVGFSPLRRATQGPMRGARHRSRRGVVWLLVAYGVGRCMAAVAACMRDACAVASACALYFTRAHTCQLPGTATVLRQ